MTLPDQTLAHLRALQPLQKVHYSWSIPLEELLAESDRLKEYVRLTHSLCLNTHWVDIAHIEAAVRVCCDVNAESPAIPATLALAYEVGKRDTDQKLEHHLVVYDRRLNCMAAWIGQVNRRLHTSVRVSAILLESEWFPRDEELVEKHDAFYQMSKQRFPEADVDWYGFGAVVPGRGPSGWSADSYFDPSDKHDAYSVSLYRVPEIHGTHETFKRTAANALEYGTRRVNPWVALGSGYRRQIDGSTEWCFGWDYDLIYSWTLGYELNDPWFGDRPERFAPWHAAKCVYFWPPPFDDRCSFWMRHFIAYVRGANGVRELPEDM